LGGGTPKKRGNNELVSKGEKKKKFGGGPPFGSGGPEARKVVKNREKPGPKKREHMGQTWQSEGKGKKRGGPSQKAKNQRA